MDTTSIWNSFHEGLYAYILKQVRNPDDAHDILQDVFLKIHLKLDTLTEQEKLANWVYRIARNSTVDHFRKHQPTGEVDDIPAETENSRHEFEKCLLPFIDQLSPSYRDALLHTELGNMSQKDYALQTHSAYSTVKSRVQRAKQQLHGLFMACCQPVFDRYGNLVDKKKENCHCGCTV